jgi:hypothetical protein
VGIKGVGVMEENKGGTKMTTFGTLYPDGTLANVRLIKQSDLRNCPFCIMVAEHYREDGTCKCNDPKERARMRKEWGYKDSDFRKAGLTE